MESPRDEPYHITIEIANKQCKVLRMLKELGIEQFRVIDVRGVAGGLIRHLVRMPSNQFEKMPKSLIRIQSSDKFKKQTAGWFDSDGCDVCNTILSHSPFLISGMNIEDYTLMYTFITPNFDAFKRIISTLESIGLKPKILEIGRYEPKKRNLTEKQERVLWFAFKTGFFDYPRKVDTSELSRKLGIKPSTLSEITRRGIRRLLEDYFET